MFTGLIADVGRVLEVTHRGRSSRLTMATELDLSDAELGESVAVNGACLTVVELARGRFSADVSPETLDRTTLGRLRRGHRVHLERSLRLSDRLGGHLVLGHVDGTGRIERRRAEANAWHLRFSAPPEVARLLVPKGCVAVDGVSLTVNTCDSRGFEVTIVPHTADQTFLVDLKPGEAVNLEADVIGKYVAGLLLDRAHAGAEAGLLDVLRSSGLAGATARPVPGPAPDGEER